MNNPFGIGDPSSMGLPGGNPMQAAGLSEMMDLVRRTWASFSLPPSIAPTVDPNEIERRITELKAVEQWLVMNLTMLRGTIQALEIQRSTLAALMTAFGPTTVRTQDWTIAFGTGDNADHTATGLFVQQAHRDYASAHTLVAYEGYPAWTRLPDVTGADLAAKQSAFQAYATDDSLMCLEPWCPGDLVSSLRLARQYVTASESIGNSARGPGVRVTASSQDTWTGQTAANAVDGFVRASGAPAKEWATDGGRAGSWIQLDFPAPTTINGVVLYDRPNLDDQITGGTLLFSDGSAVPTGALANNGSARTIRFPARITTSLRLLITSVSASTRNIGLTQLETYGNMPPAG